MCVCARADLSMVSDPDTSLLFAIVERSRRRCDMTLVTARSTSALSRGSSMSWNTWQVTEAVRHSRGRYGNQVRNTLVRIEIQKSEIHNHTAFDCSSGVFSNTLSL